MSRIKKRAEFEHRAGDPPHRLTRTRRLTPEEAARDRAMRAAVTREFPPAPFGLSISPQLRSLASRLKQARRESGFSLADLAKRTGIDKAYLSRLENAQQANTTLETLRRIAEALGKDLVVSFNGDGRPKP